MVALRLLVVVGIRGESQRAVAVMSMVGGGGKKRVAMFGEHDCQTNIVCYPSQINKWIPAHSGEYHFQDHSSVNSGIIKFHWNEKISRPPC